MTSGALVLLCINAAAQTPDSALRFFKQAQKKLAQGEFARQLRISAARLRSAPGSTRQSEV